MRWRERVSKSKELRCGKRIVARELEEKANTNTLRRNSTLCSILLTKR
jgi:hypothetical protein